MAADRSKILRINMQLDLHLNSGVPCSLGTMSGLNAKLAGVKTLSTPRTDRSVPPYALAVPLSPIAKEDMSDDKKTLLSVHDFLIR